MGPAWYGVSRPRLRVACHHERTWGAMSMPRVVLCDVRVGHADADLRAQTRSSVSKKDGWTGEGGRQPCAGETCARALLRPRPSLTGLGGVAVPPRPRQAFFSIRQVRRRGRRGPVFPPLLLFRDRITSSSLRPTLTLSRPPPSMDRASHRYTAGLCVCVYTHLCSSQSVAVIPR